MICSSDNFDSEKFSQGWAEVGRGIEEVGQALGRAYPGEARHYAPIEFHGLAADVAQKHQESVWIMAFKQGQLSEDDITSFAKECKKYHHKIQRNIIVSLQEIDSNAKLKAMEEKIWTWDLNNLNQILDLYSKPWVIA